MFCIAFSHAKPPRNIHEAREVTLSYPDSRKNSRRITYGIGCVWGMPSLPPLSSLASTEGHEARKPNLELNSAVLRWTARPIPNWNIQMLIFTNNNWWKNGEAERRFIFHSHKTGCIRNHSILCDTRSNPVWSQIVSLCYSCVIQHISIVLKAT